MAKQAVEEQWTFLKRQSPTALADLLLELAAQYEGVQKRLDRFQMSERPDKLAANFRKTLAAWKRSKKFYSYRESSGFGLQLERWLMQVANELTPKDPAAALALFEAFITSDASWFECADDSDGCIGDAMRCACDYWLEAARQCESPPDEWPHRIAALYRADEYGGRENLLRHADTLLGESGLQNLVAAFEQELADALASNVRDRPGTPSGIYRISGALSLLSDALRDPDILVRAVCSYSAQPNGLQKEQFASAYLKANRPSDALPWLEQPWEAHLEARRQSLLSDALARLGRGQESTDLRRQVFENSLSVHDYQRWSELLPAADLPQAHEHARVLALGHADPCIAAELLVFMEEAHDAQAKLVEMAGQVDGRRYETLPKLAAGLIAKRCFKGATVLYRALLNSILERANSMAYGHAARYWWKLHEINANSDTLDPLESHIEYETMVRAKHLRKAAFWAQVEAQAKSS